MKLERYKAPAYASLALAFASLGDAFLYPFLPVNAASVGVPALWVGVLLSINRFVRIFSNTWMVYLFAQHGLRLITILAVILAMVSTAGYALASTVFFWLLFRIAWGLSFSAMRISTLGYALQHPRQGLSLGFTRGIQEAGPFASLLLVPVLLSYFNATNIFFVLAVLSLPALYFACKLPAPEKDIPIITNRNFQKIPSVLNSITFTTAFLIDGVIVLVLGVLFLEYHENISLFRATSLAAFYLAYRRLCLVVFSPTGGWIADRVGLGNVFQVSLAAVVIGLLFILIGWVETGAIILFTFYSIHSAITPGKISYQQNHPLLAVAENATWRDIGAALGTLIGGLLLASDYLMITLAVATILLICLLIANWKKFATIKLLYSWK
jgi:DHA1 family multidrug resistance protein-like MFS transporter